jgi:hypothetical protein
MHASRAGEENGCRPVRGDSGSRGVDFGRMSVVEQAEKLLSSVLERTRRMFIRLGLSTSQLSPIRPRSPLAQFRSSTSLGCTVVESTSSRVSNISSFAAAVVKNRFSAPSPARCPALIASAVPLVEQERPRAHDDVDEHHQQNARLHQPRHRLVSHTRAGADRQRSAPAVCARHGARGGLKPV